MIDFQGKKEFWSLFIFLFLWEYFSEVYALPEIAELRKSDTNSSSNDILSRKKYLKFLKMADFPVKERDI